MIFYTSIFKNSKIIKVSRYDEASAKVAGQPIGSIMTASFEINGQTFMVLNGGPLFKFTEAMSFFVSCDNQSEVDEYWNKLIEGGGKEGQCGWLKDKFGVSWQIIPKQLGGFLGNPNPIKAQKAMQAMLQMHKLDLQIFEKAIK